MIEQLIAEKIIQLTPQLLSLPFKQMWYDYDKESDVLYMDFKEQSFADDGDLTDDDIIFRYEKGKIVGITVLHASKRGTKSPAHKQKIKALK